jgi:hypothetical protein
MPNGELARPHLAGMAVDLDLGDDRDHRSRALGIGDAAAGQRVAPGLRRGRPAVGPRRGARLPLGALGHRLDDGDVAWGPRPWSRNSSAFNNACD